MSNTVALTMRDRAVALANQGFKVFPLQPGTKVPAVPDRLRCIPRGQYFDEVPTDDSDTVYHIWSTPEGDPLSYNIGICTNDLLVIDIDNKGGKDGLPAWLYLIRELGIPELTVMARTPTGGQHRFYRLPPGEARARNTVGVLGEGVDTRGWHGYVVAPGSVVPAGEYKWLLPPGEQAMATVPDSLLSRCLAGKPNENKTLVAEGLELDTERAIARVTAWLLEDAPDAVQGAGGDVTTLYVAMMVGDMGISEPVCLELMDEHWNSGKAHPPWSPEELEVKVANAYAYRQEPIGCRSPEADFDAVDVEIGANAGSTAPRKRLFWEGFDKARKKMATDGTAWLVRNYLGRNEMSVLYGDSNTGKTFVALDFDYHIATGMPWNGNKVHGGLVVYVAAEAGTGIRARLEALHRQYKPDREPPLVVVPCQVDLVSPNAELGPLLALLDEVSKTYGMPIAKVTLDTLARVIGPGDENSAKDMGQLVRSMDRIRVETGGAHTQTVHHSGKNATKGARGSSALRAATDTELEIEGGRIIMRKQRNGELVRPVGFRLVPVELGKDEDGQSVTSCTIELGATVDFEPQLTAEQQEWVDQLEGYTTMLGLEQFTTDDMALAWKNNQEVVNAAIGGVAASLPARTVRSRAATLVECGNLKIVSKDEAKTKLYTMRQ